MKTRIVIAQCLLGALLSISSLMQMAVAADGLQARLSTNTIGLGDTVTLTLSADAERVKSNPDLSPLQADFDILSQSSSSQTTIMNGDRNATISWSITLAPTSQGTLDIPPISAGTLSSNALSLDVLEAGSLPAGTSASQDITVELVVDNKPHYVHGEIPITVRITDGAGLTDASLQVPGSQDFTLQQTGEDDFSQSEQDGKTESVMQRHYLLTPLKSGELMLPAVLLQGSIPAPANQSTTSSNPGMPSVFGGSPFGSSLFDRMFNPGQQVRVLSKPVTLDIKANPVNDSSWFLPAKEVKLSAKWSSQKPTFKVGEAVPRTIQLFALGAAREKLPTLEFAGTDGARMYLDRSDDKSVDTAQGTAAVREFSVSIVPTRSGEITLPAIEVNWWDTQADEQRTASLPAETISVTGGTLDTTTDIAGSTQPLANATPQDDIRQTPDTPDSFDTRAPTSQLLLWSGLTIAALTGGALLVLRYRRTPLQPAASGTLKPGSLNRRREKKLQQQVLRQLHSQVVNSSKNNQPEASYAAFRAWHATAIPGEPLSSLSLQDHHPGLAIEFDKLESRFYQAGALQTWDGNAFLNAFQESSTQLEKHEQSISHTTYVPALYPA
ncbi:BatD family protein [Granulosicoccus antarcticus]|uniref:DUF7939 domain-containing protein n=1 Tax=Granulosicoccus antarcticus IMCC3135 TaxID=1192854 RepID=A0A2Z2P2T1_9GAMM|nr:BatD family protein [Granulosicoccus antarcticus]ASJ75680.1 hypothetical protein IMCC3135_28140 [Granulosicoccus antarcticus IMCC3135]